MSIQLEYVYYTLIIIICLYTHVCIQTYAQIFSDGCVVMCGCCWGVVPDPGRGAEADGGAAMNVHFLTKPLNMEN